MPTERICTVPGCGKPFNARGLCKAHYTALKRKGLPSDYVSEEERYRQYVRAFVEKTLASDTDDCILWPFGCLPNGYGYVDWDKKRTGAHRLLCRLAHGEPASEEMHAAHSCIKGHKNCVNPRHIRWATPLENLKDVWIHGLARNPNYRDERRVRTRATYQRTVALKPPAPKVKIRRSIIYKLRRKADAHNRSRLKRPHNFCV